MDAAHQVADEEDADLRLALADLGQLSLGQVPLTDMLTTIAEFAVLAVAGADGAGLTLLREGSPATVVTSAEFVTQLEKVQYGIGEGPCVSAAKERRTVISADLGVDRSWPRFGRRANDVGVHSALSVPLIVDDEVVGAINIYARTRSAFNERAAHLAHLFSIPAAVSVRNARDLTHARTLAGQLETALTSRATIDHAIGVFVARTGCTPAEAFDKLRTISQAENTRVAVIAEHVVTQAMRAARSRHNED